MAKKRRIDRIRESAGSIEIDAADDHSGITGFVNFGDKLHVVKKKGIYQISFPDDIDPDRTNPDLKPTYQRVLSYGSDNLYVAQVLLTAQNLFHKNNLPANIDTDELLELAFDCLKNLVAMDEMVGDLEKAQKRAEKDFRKQKKNKGSLSVPSITDLKARVDTYSQKSNQVVSSLHKIVKLFYGRIIKKPWIESLSSVVEKRFGIESPFTIFLRTASPVLQLVIHVRNLIEHPNVKQRVIVSDYTIGADGKISIPVVEVIHKKTPRPPIAITLFMRDVADHLATIFEIMTVNLCATHIRADSVFPVFVAEIPEKQRRHSNVRFGYAVQFGDSVVPFSSGS